MSAPNPKPPENELGQVTQAGLMDRWSVWVDDAERVPELRWHPGGAGAVEAYEKMMNDTQMKGLYLGVVLPVSRYLYTLNPNGAPDSAVERISKNYGIPVKGAEPENRQRKQGRFNFGEHLRLALKAIYLGHYYFEQVGEVDEVTLDWNLRKLAPRPPKTIGEIDVAQDGGLVGIKQWLGTDPPLIPVERLVAYVWDQDPGNWTGRSMFRPCYRNWVIKDRLLRVDAILHERAGGIPVGKAPQGASAAEVREFSRLAQAFKVGEAAGGAVPAGAELKIERPTAGAVVQSLRFHNEEMAKAFLAMFMQLGQTQTGSYALGSSFIDFFSLALDSVSLWFCEKFTEHMIEDDVDWNEGPGVLAPILEAERVEDPELQVADLAKLVEDNIIQVDNNLEEALRKRYRLPEKGTPRKQPTPALPPAQDQPALPPASPSPTPAAKDRRGRAVEAASGGTTSPSASLPDRPLRRNPYEHELASRVDFAAMEDDFIATRDGLVTSYNKLRDGAITDLVGQVADAGGDLGKITAITSPVVGEDIIGTEMKSMFTTGATAARAEAKAQGKTIALPNVDDVADALEARASAVAGLLAKDLESATIRKALSLAGGALGGDEVAAAVATYLANLSTGWSEARLGGALMQAMNTGRREVMASGGPKEIYASELLDTSTCENCADKDGEQYDTLADAEQDYPTGGYAECLGGDQCRGTLVAVYEEA